MAERAILHVLPHPGGGGERYVDLLADMPGWRSERFYLSPGRGPVEAVAKLPSCRRAISAAGADLVHLHGDVVAALVSPATGGVPTAITFHGLSMLRRLRGIRRAAFVRGLRRAIAHSGAAICVSESERDELAGCFPGMAGELELIHNAVAPPPPVDRAAARQELDLGEDDVAVLYAGELQPDKGVLDLLEALELARRAGAQVIGLICGDGAIRAQVDGAIGTGPDRVLGFRDDLDQIRAAADIGVLASMREGLSLSVLEGMAAGLPMVVSNGPGNPEAVGEAGVVVPYGEPSALALALEQLAGDGPRRSELGEAGRRRHAELFSPELMVERTLAAYERAVSETPLPSA